MSIECTTRFKYNLLHVREILDVEGILAWRQADVGSFVALCSTPSRFVAHGTIPHIGRDHLGQCLPHKERERQVQLANQRDLQQWIPFDVCRGYYIEPGHSSIESSTAICDRFVTHSCRSVPARTTLLYFLLFLAFRLSGAFLLISTPLLSCP